MDTDLAVLTPLVLLAAILTAALFPAALRLARRRRARPEPDPLAGLAGPERAMVEGVLRLPRTVAREVMTPRIAIAAVPADIALPELLRVVVREGYSRLPVFEGSIDHVVGVLVVKDLLPLLAGHSRPPGRVFDLRSVMRAPYFVPDAKPIGEVLAELRRQSVHLAIVLDEFGGTYGLLTADDVVAEVLGEIRDEHDLAAPAPVQVPGDAEPLIDGGEAVSEVNERWGLALSEEDFDTVGGWVFGRLGRIPEVGDEVDGVGPDAEVVLRVEEVEDRRAVRLRLVRRPAPAALA